MLNIRANATILGICLVTFTALAETSRGDFIVDISATVTPQSGGLSLYQYTLINESGSSLPAVEFSLDVDPSASLASITGPTAWLITYSNGDSLLDFSSLSPTTDIQPGVSAIFSFFSPLGPVLQDYQVLGLVSDPFMIAASQGQVLGPGASTVPEPSTFTLLGIGGLGLCGYSWRCRRRKSEDPPTATP